MRHITGGSFYEKIKRILPCKTKAVIEKNSWKVPEIFRIIQKKANMSEKDIYRTFNMGIGMGLIVRRDIVFQIKKFLKSAKIIGFIKEGERGVELI